MSKKMIPIEPSGEPIYDSFKEREQNIIGSRIQKARIERGLSLTGFGRLLEKSGLTIHRQGINRWETGCSVPNAYQLVFHFR